VTREQIEVITSMYREDISYAKIAAELGLTENIVKHWVRTNRKLYELPRRRNLAEKSGVLSESTMLDSKWDIKRGVEWIKRRWSWR
jgi:transposase